MIARVRKCFSRMRFPFRFSYEIFLFFFYRNSNLSSKFVHARFNASRNFCKRERESTFKRTSCGNVFYIVGTNFYSICRPRSNFSRLVGFEGWAYLRIVTRTRRSITNREPPGVKYTRDFIDIQPRTSKNSYAVREEGPRQPYVRENTWKLAWHTGSRLTRAIHRTT